MPSFEAWINPLKCTEIDTLPTQPNAAVPNVPEAQQLLNYLCAPGVDHSREAIAARYREISATPDPLPIVPAEPTILEKLVWPLRHAKGSYALGNFVGCIALCGTVGEMVAVLLWDISKMPLQGKPLAESQQRALFGRTFEKLGQERRVDILHTFALIDDDTKAAFDNLRTVRRRYLHLLSHAHTEVVRHARQAYGHALKVVAIVLGQTYKKGAVVLRPELMAYLAEKGIVRAEEPGNGA